MDLHLIDEYLELTAALAEAEDTLALAPADPEIKKLLPHQVPPPHDWDGWVLTGGRGGGKTMAGAHWMAALAARTPGLRGRIIAPTLADAVNGAVYDPDSGILAADPSASFKPSGVEGVRVTWPNGSTVWCLGTPTLKDVDRLRALTNMDCDWFEEAAANPMLAHAVTQASLSRRGKRLPRPLWIATTTPRPVATLKGWLADDSVTVTRASTFDNPYTPEAYRRRAESLHGTRLYKQEVLGEVIDDVEGALWSLADIERSYATIHSSDLVKVVVGVDPPSGSGTCGIVVVGRDASGHLYVLDDYSVTDATPHQWASAAAAAAQTYGALVVAEINQGGRMVTEVLHSVDPALAVTTVNAAVNKRARAEPIATLWEATYQSAHMAPARPDALGLLIDQLLEWDGSFSPDRLDAMVWASTYLLVRGEGTLHARSSSMAPRPPSPHSLMAARVGGMR